MDCVLSAVGNSSDFSSCGFQSVSYVCGSRISQKIKKDFYPEFKISFPLLSCFQRFSPNSPVSLIIPDSFPWFLQQEREWFFFHWSSSQGTGCDACQLQKIKLFSCCSVSDPQVIVCLFVFSSLLFSSVIFCWRLHVLEAYSSKQKWNLQLITLNQQCHKTNLKNALLHLNTPLSCSSLKIF